MKSALGTRLTPSADRETVRDSTRGGRAPLSTVWGIRSSRRGDVPIERRGRQAEAVRDLSHADVRIGQHRLGGLDVVVREFRRTASRAANAPRRGPLGCARGSSCARIPLMRQTCERPAAPARSSCRGLRSGCETRCAATARSRRFRSIASSTAPADRASTRSACRRCAQIRARHVEPGGLWSPFWLQRSFSKTPFFREIPAIRFS